MHDHHQRPTMHTSAPAAPTALRSIPGVCELEWIGREADDPRPPRLLVEMPHAATRTADYHALRQRLRSEIPEDLVDFFHVNTDVGSFEYGRRTAELYVATAAGSSCATGAVGALTIRCLIPRTFIDTNRRIDGGADEAAMTAAINEYIHDPADRELLFELHVRYHELVARACALTCENGGYALLPHSYAPRSVAIDSFDAGVGRALRAAYEPERYASWALRPEIDLITAPPGGTSLAPEAVRRALIARFTAAGLEVKENESYPLHPITMGHQYSARYPGQVLCLEVRRDLLADPFTPFAEMQISPSKVERIAAPLAAALL